MKLADLRLALLAIILASSAGFESRADQVVSQNEAIDQLISQSDEIIGLEAVVAAGTDTAFYSRFGHAMLRFVKADGNFSTDMVLSFKANIETQNISIRKGLFGGYQVLPIIQTFDGFWAEYVKNEKRPLMRYVILSTPEMRAKLLQTLKNWVDNPSQAGDYTFLKNNCVGALSKLFEHAGFPSTLGPNPVVPTHLDRWLKHSLLSPFPAVQVESSKGLFDHVSALLNVSLQNLTSGNDWPTDAAQTLNTNLSDLQIKQLLLQLTKMPGSVRQALASEHRFGNGGASMEEAMTFKPIPNELYQVCADAECAQNVIRLGTRLWSEGEWNSAIKQDDSVFGLALGENSDQTDERPVGARGVNKSFLAVPEIVRYYQIFIDAVFKRDSLKN